MKDQSRNAVGLKIRRDIEQHTDCGYVSPEKVMDIVEAALKMHDLGVKEVDNG